MGRDMPNSKTDQDIDRISHLNQSFTNFTDIVEELNESYQGLERRFESLNNQLEETNYQLRQALVENQKVRSFLHELTAAVPSGIVVYDLEGNITLMNKAAEELLETNLEDASQTGLGFISDSNPDYSAMKTVSENRPFLSEEKKIFLKTGKELTVSFSTALLYDQDRKVIGALELYHDISRIRRLEDEITRVKTLAALGEIAATVAHEVRNPLGGILGFAALLKRDLEDDPRVDLVEKIIRGVKNLDQSVSSLLRYAQEEHPDLKTVQLKPLLEELIHEFRMNLAQCEEKCHIDLIVSPESLSWKMDPGHLRQCVLNLLLNAHQAQKENSRISLSVIGDNKLNIIVSDRGSGMTEKVKQKLFTPFFTTRKAGTGLGLATVKKLVLLHKGEIKVDTEIGRGTDIRLEIPADLK
ncbi:MAG: PAS domain S-box protein [candidate division Zixibacteria bacterium]|nr:PAS domain S-box protein [candidate division Zixibacteria bacterium]